MKRNLYVVLICFLLAGSGLAQKTKPWTEWSKGDTDKILNNSAWGQSQTKGEGPAGLPQGYNAGNANTNRGTGATQEAIPTDYRIRYRLISAKPIREGIARRLILAQPDKAKELTEQLQPIIDKGFGDFIVIGVNYEGADPRTVRGLLRDLAKLNTGALAGKAYLERKDGKRVELVDYKAPIADDMGGKFIFARTLDGNPFLATDSGTVRFVANVSDTLKFDVKFKVADMLYGEKLEY